MFETCRLLFSLYVSKLLTGTDWFKKQNRRSDDELISRVEVKGLKLKVIKLQTLCVSNHKKQGLNCIDYNTDNLTFTMEIKTLPTIIACVLSAVLTASQQTRYLFNQLLSTYFDIKYCYSLRWSYRILKCAQIEKMLEAVKIKCVGGLHLRDLKLNITYFGTDQNFQVGRCYQKVEV